MALTLKQKKVSWDIEVVGHKNQQGVVVVEGNKITVSCNGKENSTMISDVGWVDFHNIDLLIQTMIRVLLNSEDLVRIIPKLRAMDFIVSSNNGRENFHVSYRENKLSVESKSTTYCLKIDPTYQIIDLDRASILRLLKDLTAAEHSIGLS